MLCDLQLIAAQCVHKVCFFALFQQYKLKNTYIEIRVVSVSDDCRRVEVEIVQGEVVGVAAALLLVLLLLLLVMMMRPSAERVVARDLLHRRQLLHGPARRRGGRRGGGTRRQRAAAARAQGRRVAVPRRRRHHARARRVRCGWQDRRARPHPNLALKQVKKLSICM